jgi:hypothetical protein
MTTIMTTILQFIILSLQLMISLSFASSALRVFTLQNFSASTSTGDWLLVFHGESEGHSKRFLPIFKRVASHLQFLESPVGCGTVECTKNHAICQAFNIYAYPTIKMKTADGDVVEFKGRRELDVMRDFVFQYNSARNLDKQKISDDRRAKKTADQEAKKQKDQVDSAATRRDEL